MLREQNKFRSFRWVKAQVGKIELADRPEIYFILFFDSSHLETFRAPKKQKLDNHNLERTFSFYKQFW